MRLFLCYIKQNRRVVLASVVFIFILAVSFSLYRLPVAAVGYASLVCAFFGALFLIPDYRNFYKKHRQLRRMEEETHFTAEHLPAPRGVLEEDYQTLVKSLYADKLRLADQMDSRYTDLVEYYTVWAHQIKTPIAAMRLTLQSEDSPQNRELSEELQRIEQYVEMVLCYLRLDAGTTDYVIGTYDLDTIVRQAVRKFASQFIRRKIKLEYKPLACQVLTDEKWLLFVVEQILSNALKYTKSGTITISLCEPQILSVRDTGIGIAPEDLPRVFEKGYTGYNGRADKKASGIGLYLCRRICNNLGHRISISSSLDSGTEVKIDLARENLDVE